jgi:uncharacterized protein
MTPAQKFQALTPDERQMQIAAFNEACQSGTKEEVEMSLDLYGMDLYRAAITADFTPLTLAVYDNTVDVIQLLLQKGAPIDERDGSGNTPLTRAIFREDIQKVQTLLKEGADVNALAVHDSTAVLTAVMHKGSLLDLILSQPGLDIDHQSDDGRTALLHAVKTRRVGAARKLLEKGANMRLKDFAGDSPFAWAEDSGPDEMIELMYEFLEKDKRRAQQEKEKRLQQQIADFKGGLKKPMSLPPRIFKKNSPQP